MDRLTQLRGEAGGSRDSTLDTSAAVSEAYITANESSIYVSLSEDDPSFDISPIKDVSLASTISPEKSGNDQLVSTLMPATTKNDELDGGFKFEKQIEAVNILSGGIDIFDDNDNSYDGNELVIDDNVEIDHNTNPDLKLVECSELPFQKIEELIEAVNHEPAVVVSDDTEVTLHIDGKSINAINIGNGLYLFRKVGEDELAAVQLMEPKTVPPTYKFLKVRENAEGNLEVYEEIEIEVPKHVAMKGGKTNIKGAHVPIKGINKVINDPSSNKIVERKNLSSEVPPTASTSKDAKTAAFGTKSEVNLNGKMVKFNETRKAPVIHSTPNKEGIPLTKTMVDQQLHPNRVLDNVKTIEVHTDISKQRVFDIKNKDVPKVNKPASTINKEKEKSVEVANICEKSADKVTKDTETSKPKSLEIECAKVTVAEATKIIMGQSQTKATTTLMSKDESENPKSQPHERSEIQLASTSEPKIENINTVTPETEKSLGVEVKLTDDTKTNTTKPLVPKSAQTSQETLQIKPIQHSNTKPPAACENLKQNVTTEITRSTLEDVADITPANQVTLECEESCNPTKKSKVDGYSKMPKPVTNEQELQKTSDTTPNEIVIGTVINTKNTKMLLVESKETSQTKSDLILSNIAEKGIKNEHQKMFVIEEPDSSSKTILNQPTPILQQSMEPKSTVFQNRIKSQVEDVFPSEVKTEQKPKDHSKITEKVKEPVQELPTQENNVPVASEILKIVTNEKEEEKSPNTTTPSVIILETVKIIQNANIPKESGETSDKELDSISSHTAKKDIKNEPQKTVVIDETDSSSKIINKQPKSILQQNQDPKTIVFQDIIQPQANVPSPSEVKIEQKPKEDTKVTEKDKKPLQEMPTFEKNLLVASFPTPKNNAVSTNEHVSHKNESDQKVKIVENIVLVPPLQKETMDHKPLTVINPKILKTELTETTVTVPDKIKQNTISESSESAIIFDKALPMAKHQDKELKKNVSQTLTSTKTAPKEDNIQNLNTLKQEIPKSQSIPLKMEIVNKPIHNIQPDLQKKTEVKNETAKHIVLDKKPINNNIAAVPFGKWTEANRQEFLNKIKEAKVPANTSNTKQIKQANDLNRRDVLQKIDSQRQSNNALSKAHETGNVKNEGTFVNKPTVSNPTLAFRETKASVKAEAPAPKTKPLLLKKPEKADTAHTSKVQTNLTVTSSYMLKSEGPQRNEFNNQDLIDKTIEGIINRVVVTGNRPQDQKQIVTKEQVHPSREPVHPSKEPVQPCREYVHPTKETDFTVNFKVKEKHTSILSDVIEMKMNELHGIPFVERPPHQLPKVYNRDIKTYSKTDNIKSSSNKPSKIPSLLPVAAPSQPKPVNVKDSIIDLDSEDEVIEHEPVTGDIDLHKTVTSSKPLTIIPTSVSHNVSPNISHNVDHSKKDSIITEKDFDKFYRRNSVTYSSDLYPNTKITSSTADFGAKKVASQLPVYKPSYSNVPSSKIQMTSKLVPVGEDMFGKNYPSKLQMAYQSALSTNRQMDPPITIIEDKPVKVVFMDTNTEFPPVQLNVQGQQLSPSKNPIIQSRTPEPDSLTTSTCDSLDSDVLDSIDGKVPDEAKSKTKHQRKQVLTPVEAPELELIAPCDLGIEVSPKKKRRTEDKQDKLSKSVVPKKSYLLGRNITEDVTEDLTKDIPKEIAPVNSLIIGRSDAASAIDNLVKAAELLETQSARFKPESMSSSNSESPQTPTPVKRGRGRPRKYPLPEGTPEKTKAPSPQKKPRLIDAKQKKRVSTSDDDDSSIDDIMIKENWTMGKINENIVCPICSKLFRSENVVFKHVKHCTGPSPNRSDSDKRSARRSRYSRDSQSVDSKFDDTDGESDKPLKVNTTKKRQSKEPSPDRKENVIVIEDTPVKDKKDKPEEPKKHEPRKPTKTKAQYKVSGLSCEHCGKTFRQLSYLVSHKLLHKKTNSKVPENETQTADKTVFSCEVCKKEFRKLHHLVQHRIIHNPSSAFTRPSRKSSAEQSLDNKATKIQEAKQNDDQSAAFRCEPCDKSFRKLHHLVEHRETHDGINRQKIISTSQSVLEKPVVDPPPQCDICKKTFRKLHHLSEHKEQHNMDLGSEKSDEKGAKSALSTKDIIHECSLCYMVFPNEHSLNKHLVKCQKKKRQSAAKQAKQAEEAAAVKNEEIQQEIESTAAPPQTSPKPTEDNDIVTEASENVEKAKDKEIAPKITEEIPETKQKVLSKEKESKPTDQSVPPKASKRDLEEPQCSIEKSVDDMSEVPIKVKKTEDKSVNEVKETEPSKKKSPVKEKEQTTTVKRRKSNLPLARIEETAIVESSDDDEVRYMLNPDYKDPKLEPEAAISEAKLFMKVRSNKRNSLQFDRPKSKDAKRRTSLQNPSKVTRKSKSTEKTVEPPNITPISIPEVPATDSDDSDVKYSFPVKTQKPAETDKIAKTPKAQTPKEKRKSLVEKRKTLSGIARRKSVGKTASVKHIAKVAPTKEVKKRRVEAEHRCDCGELFSSAALLARHATLAHTPPRRRRPASPPPPPAPLPPKPTDSKKPIDKTTSPRKKPGRPPGKTPPAPARKSVRPEPPLTSAKKPRKPVAHRGVPVPGKMRKVMEMEKLKSRRE